MSFVFRVFFGNRQVRPWLVLVCLLLSALAEALSIGSALPALSLLSGGTNSNSSPLNLRIHDAIASLGIPTSFESLIVVMMALMILKSVLAFAVLSYVGVAAANVSIALRKRLIEAIFRVRWSYFSGQSAGTIANILANEAGRAGDAYLLSAQFVAALVQNAGYVLIAVLIDWRLALIGVAASFVLGTSMGGLMRTTKKAGRQQSVSTASLTTYLMDALANIKALKSMQRYEPVFTGIATTLKKLRRALVRRELSKAAVSQAADALGAVLIGLFLLAAHAIWKTPLPEMLVSAIVYLQIVSVTSKLLKQYQQYVQLEAAYQKAEEVVLEVEAQPEPRDGTGTVRLAEGCRFEHVNFAYDDRPVIFDATFDIPAAAVTVLSGLSGSGKTTLLDLLIGLYQPQAGHILVDGVDLADLDIAAWRRGIGYVPQELVLFHASIRDNITLRDPAIGDDAILAALRMAGGGEFIAALPRGLDTDVGEMGSKLSGGERQRISLARALVAAPRLLILDEVTSALDPETEAEIVANIAALRGRYTIVAITHRPAWTAIADRLYQVSEGRVSELQPAVAAAS